MRCELALVVALALSARTAAADAAPPRRPIEDPRPWIIGADVFSTGMIAGGAALAYAQRDCESDDCGLGGFYMMFFGGMAYVSWPAFVHDDTGHRGRGIGSAALRVTLPLAGVALAQVFERDAEATLTFAAGGMVSAMLIDWLVLARDAKRDGVAPPLSFYVGPVDGGGAIAGITGAL